MNRPKTKTVEVTLYGGFHNSDEINIRISASAAEAIQNNIAPLSGYLTPSQDVKLRKHFCGIKGCGCGNYSRATIIVR